MGTMHLANRLCEGFDLFRTPLLSDMKFMKRARVNVVFCFQHIEGWSLIPHWHPEGLGIFMLHIRALRLLPPFYHDNPITPRNHLEVATKIISMADLTVSLHVCGV